MWEQKLSTGHSAPYEGSREPSRGWERSAESCCGVCGGCRGQPARKSGTPLSRNLATPPANRCADVGNCYKRFMLKGNRLNSAGKQAFCSLPHGSPIAAEDFVMI